MKFNDFLQHVEKGKKGYNKGLSMGMPRLEKYTSGIQKSTYYILFSSEGVGKSSFAINSFICNPYLESLEKGTDVTIRYYSLEMSKIKVISKIVSWFLYHDLRVMISPTTLMSMGDRQIPKIAENYMKEKEEFFDKMFEKVHIIDKPLSPSEIKRDVQQFAASRGSINELEYLPNNENEHVILIFDTLSNLKLESNGNRNDEKGTVDLHSAFSRDIYRNKFNYSVCNVMHSNRNMSSMNRARYGDIAPKKEDIITSSKPSQDANMVLALFNPYELMNANNSLAKYRGYDIPRLKGRHRSVYLLKNRFGDNNKALNMLYIGESGYFREMNKAADMTEDHYKYVEQLKEVYDKRSEN